MKEYDQGQLFIPTHICCLVTRIHKTIHVKICDNSAISTIVIVQDQVQIHLYLFHFLNVDFHKNDKFNFFEFQSFFRLVIFNSNLILNILSCVTWIYYHLRQQHIIYPWNMFLPANIILQSLS